MKHTIGRIAAICAVLSSLPAMSVAQTSISHTDSYGPTSTGYTNHSETFTLPGFDPAWGTLESVTVSYHGQVLNSVAFENLGNTNHTPTGYVFNLEAGHGIGLLALGLDPGSISPFAPGTFELDASVWGNSSNFIASSTFLQEVHEITSPNSFDGIRDFGGTSGFTYAYGTILDVEQSVTFTDSSSLALFMGSTVTLHDFQGSGFEMRAYGGNNDFIMVTDKKGEVTVTYNFAAVPEPAAAMLGALGILLLGFRRRH
ncbi:MAG: choice-of-anchor E domain-containing protein [Akkermansiaceae bacterium]|nr:choice-of-anchor E domain-containing protein [Akkermansiaceae bacterium]